MAKFQVDVPEEEPEERPGFSFRGADPVPVGGAKTPEGSPRQKTLEATMAVLVRAHEQIQNADTQLFLLAEFVAGLKTGDRPIEDNMGRGARMIEAVRKQLINSVVALDHTALVIDLEERGVLGRHDGREFARLGVKLLEQTQEEYERWGLSAEAPGLPEEAVELMRQAAAQLESEEEKVSDE